MNPAIADIRQHWQQIKPGLEEIIARSDADFLPEDIFALCVAQKASLYLDQETGAFAVLQARQDACSGKPVLFLYCVWTPPTLSAEDYWPKIRALALDLQADYVETVSPRKGLERRWEYQYSCFRRRL